ncbi:MAG: hypothetical protein WCP79_11300 [Bacillota bacterium]
MELEQILEDERDNLLARASRLWFGDSYILNDTRIDEFIYNIKANFPESIREAQKIMAERQRILEDAQQEAADAINKANADAKNLMEYAKRDAETMLEHAKEKHARLIDEHSIMIHAQERANEIVAQSKIEAEKFAEQVNGYADSIFNYLNGSISHLSESIKSNQAQLEQALRR